MDVDLAHRDVLISSLVQAIARKHGRAASDVQGVIQKLQDNWISRLFDWFVVVKGVLKYFQYLVQRKILSPEAKKAISLPALLQMELDKYAESTGLLINHFIW